LQFYATSTAPGLGARAAPLACLHVSCAAARAAMPRAAPAPARLPPTFLGGPGDEHFCTAFNEHSRTAAAVLPSDRALLRPHVRVPLACRPPPRRGWMLAREHAAAAAAEAAEAAAAALLAPPRRRAAPPAPPAPPPPPRVPALAVEEFWVLVDCGGAQRRAWAETEAGVNDFLCALRGFAPPGATARVELFTHESRCVYAGDAAAAPPLPPLPAARGSGLAVRGLLRGPSAPLDALALAMRAAPRRPRVVLLLSGAAARARAAAAARARRGAAHTPSQLKIRIDRHLSPWVNASAITPPQAAPTRWSWSTAPRRWAR
jgi:hypothetical protein